MNLKNKIPPPVIALICLAGIYLTRNLARVESSVQTWVAAAIFAAAVILMVFAVREFKKRETTINPLQPETSTALVTSGVFERSRNPMYLGLLGIQLAAAIYLGALTAVVILPLFVLYMNLFQIAPEEAAMEKLFGDEFAAYRSRVRRWI